MVSHFVRAGLFALFALITIHYFITKIHLIKNTGTLRFNFILFSFNPQKMPLMKFRLNIFFSVLLLLALTLLPK